MKIPAAEARHLADLSALESLEIGETPLDDAALKHISGLVGLKRLYLRDVGLTDAALENLKGLSQLEVALAPRQPHHRDGPGSSSRLGRTCEVLNLARNPLADDGLAHLAGLKELNTLTLADTAVTGAGLVHLKPLAKMRVLNLDRTKTADGDLVRLEGFQNMRMLYLHGCKVTRGERIETRRCDCRPVDLSLSESECPSVQLHSTSNDKEKPRCFERWRCCRS